jgi:hypothetical protein
MRRKAIWPNKYNDFPKISELCLTETSYFRMFRLNPKRKLGELFSSGSGGCTNSHSGIGNISFVEDLLTDTVVTTKFNCSKFGHHTHPTIGWVSI